jgi:hypothetical protein
MADKMFYIKDIKGTHLELCYVTGWVEAGYCNLFARDKKSQKTIYDFGTITHQEASVIWGAITDDESLMNQVNSKGINQ